MQDFQGVLKKLFEADKTPEPELQPIVPPEGRFDIGVHKKRMANTNDASEMLRIHLEAQAFEFQKLKKAYSELKMTIESVMGEMGTFGIEDKGFMKGRLAPMAPHGQPSDQSTAQALAGARDFRNRMAQPITPNEDI